MNILHVTPEIQASLLEVFPPVGVVSPTGEITFDDSTQEFPSLPDILEDEEAPFPPPKEGDFEKGYLTCWGDKAATTFRRFVNGQWIYCSRIKTSYFKIHPLEVAHLIYVPIHGNQYPKAYEACLKASRCAYDTEILSCLDWNES